MRRLGVWGLGAALLIGWAAAGTAVAGDTTDDADAKPAAKQSGGGSWFGNWFGTGSSSAKKPDKKPDKAAKPKAARPAAGLDSVAGVRDREEAALLRRMAVCDKLRQIADQTSDDSLSKLADQLEQRAEAVYYQRINTLPASRTESQPEQPVVQKTSAREPTWSLRETQPHVVTGRSASADPIAEREEGQP